MTKAIEIEGLNKSYGKVRAVKDLSFSVDRGEFFAFLGVNGAGKSTTISVLCGTLPPDSGKVRVLGNDISSGLSKIKESIGVVFQDSRLDRALTVRDNLFFRGALYGLGGKELQSRIDEVTELLELGDILNRKISRLSGGQRRRADIARALVHRPELLILDEPTTGLDPQTRQNLWNVISGLRSSRKLTVLLTTHYMEEAAGADRVLIIDGGALAAEGTPLELKNRYCGDFIDLYGVSEADAASLNCRYSRIAGGYRLQVPSTAKATELIIAYPKLFLDYEIVKGNMDHVFLAVTGKKLAGENLGEGGKRK